jgi:phosphoserine phosphatase
MIALVAALLLAPVVPSSLAGALPSWNEGKAKSDILQFVTQAVTPGSKGFVPPQERIATFDNDGTLWAEVPTVEVAFTMHRLKALAEKERALREKQPYKAALEGDHEYLEKAGPKALLELVGVTHGGMSPDEFQQEVRAFFAAAKHPRFHEPFQATAYVPMLELMALLRDNGFQVWICTGGTQDFVRVISLQTYGIPPERVIGSTIKIEWEGADKGLQRQKQLARVNDKAGKPVGIQIHIGQKPALAAGNVKTGGDIEMLEMVRSREGLALLVNHDDAEREFAYSEKNGESLTAAAEHGFTVISMKKDWKKIFAFDRKGSAGP